MKKLILLIGIFFSGIAFGQVSKEDSLKNYKVENVAEFPKGYREFRNMISENLRTENVIGDGKYHCDLYFVIDTDGSITDVKTTGDNESFNKEAEIAIAKIKDKWIPATINGVPVRYRFRVPLDITFEGVSDAAKFSKGEEFFKKMIVENFRIEKVQSHGTEHCVIFFVVEQYGEISKIKSLGKNQSFNKEVVRAVSKIKEKWIPKFVRGFPVASEIQIPFEMKIE